MGVCREMMHRTKPNARYIATIAGVVVMMLGHLLPFIPVGRTSNAPSATHEVSAGCHGDTASYSRTLYRSPDCTDASELVT